MIIRYIIKAIIKTIETINSIIINGGVLTVEIESYTMIEIKEQPKVSTVLHANSE